MARFRVQIVVSPIDYYQLSPLITSGTRIIERENWADHKSRCGANALNTNDSSLDADDAAEDGQITVSIESIWPRLQEFVESYRGLMLLSMVNAFGWASYPPTPSDHIHHHHEDSEFPRAPPAQILYVTLTAAPHISGTTKGKAAFRVRDAEALSIDEFRRSATDIQHRLHRRENAGLLNAYDEQVAQSHRYQGRKARVSMCVMRMKFFNGARGHMYFKNWYYVDDVGRDYSAQWRPVDWLDYLKKMVARGKGWHRDDVQFD